MQNYLLPSQGHEKVIHVAAVQTCGSREHVRLALCSAVRHCACSALYVCMCVFTVHSVCAVECGTECVRAARSQCPRPCVFFGQGKIECMFAESSLTPTHALYCPREDGRGGRWTSLRAHVCGGRHVHVVNTHSHALRYAALHYSCSVQYVCSYVRMFVCTYVRMYVCTYVCMYVCMYVCVHVLTCL